LNTKIKCSCGCKTKLVVQEESLKVLGVHVEGKEGIKSIELGEKQAVKIINFLTKWIDQQRIMNNEKIRK
jgi:maltose-binding protein MalE